MAYSYLTPFRRGPLRASGTARGGGSIFDLHRQMNRLFDDLFDTGGTAGSLVSGGSHPAMDILQEEDRVEITAELPGVREEDIDLTVEEGVLVLSGEKKSTREDRQTGYCERSYGRFERRITLPSNIDEDKIEAKFEDGVLTVNLPRTEKQGGRKIELGGSTGRRNERAGDAVIEQRDSASSKSGQNQDERQSEPA